MSFPFAFFREEQAREVAAWRAESLALLCTTCAHPRLDHAINILGRGPGYCNLCQCHHFTVAEGKVIANGGRFQ